EDPKQEIGAISMLSDQEQELLSGSWNRSVVEVSQGSTIVSSFSRQAVERSKEPAVVFEDRTLSYGDLDAWSTKLARGLRDSGVRRGSLVGLYLDRGIEMLVGMLGILKAGGAYVPIDLEFPSGRVRSMLGDSGAEVLVSKSLDHPMEGIRVIDPSEVDRYSATPLPEVPEGSDLGYVIYTSGTTGEPKGVKITHDQVMDYVSGLEDKISISKNKSYALVSSIATDLGNTVVYGSLLSGGTLHVMSKTRSSDSVYLREYFTRQGIDCLKIVPSHWEALSEGEEMLLPKSQLIFGGEALSGRIVERIYGLSGSCEVINHYGPTETTIGKLLYRVPREGAYPRTVPIGAPFGNTVVYVLSESKTLSGIGVPGELYIGGRGVSSGYLNKEELTREKFIKDPIGGNGLLYSTGDRVRYTEEGVIEFLGRTDDQVKIRGYRIELKEIEKTLESVEQNQKVVVLIRKDENENSQIIAFIKCSGEFKLQEQFDYVRRILPDYLIPSAMIHVEEFQLLPNGKIDNRKLLSLPIESREREEYKKPITETEKKLVKIWEELLDSDKIGIHDNFFELGGDSIITIQLVSRARKVGLELQVGDVFTYQTISRLSNLIGSRESLKKLPQEQGELTGTCGLTPIQLWFFDKKPKSISHFNQSLIFKANKQIEGNVLKRCTEQLLSHHDALRFKYFKDPSGNWKQVYSESNEPVFYVEEIIDGSQTKVSEWIEKTCEKYQRSLDIEKGEVFKVVFLKTNKKEDYNRLFLVAHHLVVDAVSWRILVEDILQLVSAIYNGKESNLDEKTSSYRQWSDALNRFANSDTLQRELGYWKAELAFCKPAVATKFYKSDFKQLSVSLNKKETENLLKGCHKTFNTDLNDFVISSISECFAEQFSAKEIILEMEGHGRETVDEEIDLTRTVGWFTSHYPLSLDLSGLKDKADLLCHVKEKIRNIPKKGIGFGVLKYLNKELYGSDYHCDIKYNYLGQLDNLVDNEYLILQDENTGANMDDHFPVGEPLLLTASIRGGELQFTLDYSEKKYSRKKAEKFLKGITENLLKLIDFSIELGSSEIFPTPSDYNLGGITNVRDFQEFLKTPINGNTIKESFESIYPLTGLQEGMLFHTLMDEGVDTYTRQLSCDIYELDIEKLKKSWELVLDKHSSLRSAFYPYVFKVPVQVVFKKVELPLTYFDLRKKNTSEIKALVEELKTGQFKNAFNLSYAPLIKLAVAQISTDQYVMILTWHHLIFDGWSMPIIMEEVLKNYDILIKGKISDEYEEDKYEDFIKFYQDYDSNHSALFWKNKLLRLEAATTLPFIRPKGVNHADRDNFRETLILFNKVESDQIRSFCRDCKITLNTFIQGIWSLLLHRYTGSESICYGITVSGRPENLPGVEQKVGMYINTIPFLSIYSENAFKKDWLQELQNNLQDTRPYQYTPLSAIQQDHTLNTELFDTILVFENYPVNRLIKDKKWSLKIENIKTIERSNYPLSLVVYGEDKISVRINSDPELLPDFYIQRLMGHFKNVAFGLVQDSVSKLSELNLLSPEEQKQIESFNQTEVQYPKDKTIVELFEHRVKKTPNQTALVYEGKTMSYQELNRRSNRLAHYLIKHGVTQDTLVPLCMERSMEMIVAMLGILKSGGAYVPIDPEYPQQRLDYMLKDTGSGILLGTAQTALLQRAKAIKFVDVQEVLESSYSEEDLSEKPSPGGLMYVIYTSGSTGHPKGVMITHESLLDHCYGLIDSAGLKGCRSYALFSPLVFDAGHAVIFSSLIQGGQLHVLSAQQLGSPPELGRYIKSRGIDCIKIVPTLWTFYSDSGVNLLPEQVLIFGGESLTTGVLKRLGSYGGRVYNHYGPTEATIGKSIHTIDPDRNYSTIPIGKPFSNSRFYVKDPGGMEVPIGVPGELYIGGKGLAEGYLNLPELTKEKFIQTPQGRQYRTGDVVRWTQEGEIEYLGRIDDQV
ncbi:MAG: amino acid adenylation domain-containing protein, partial [Flavobacteriales bacterium]|nr:amino acid adenylation domain-containing protein [Flavobacteriales bacterium]